MNNPRINSDERGITLNKSLAWTMVVGETSYGQTYMKSWTKSMWDTYRASYGTTVWNWP